MNIKRNLKRICICSASLMMVTSLGAGINNISAKRVHRHIRTKRIVKSSSSLYKQGERDLNNYGATTTEDQKLSKKVYKHIINKLIQTHFNKSYIKGLHLLNPKKYNGFSGASNWLYTPILSQAKRVMYQRHHKSAKRKGIRHHKNIKRHATKKHRKYKHDRKIIAKKHHRKNRHTYKHMNKMFQ